MIRNLFVDSFLTSLLASETSASASFSMIFRYPEFAIFLLALLQLVNDINIESKNSLLPEFAASLSSSCRINPMLRSSWINLFRFLGIETILYSASAAISRISYDFASRNLTNSGINPVSPIAFLASSEVPQSLNAAFNANS
ncbi:hypothetical protein CISIN_1g032414mg [Citrus sinensis]|uniref:Uncharacterized protein n=1 Tax=Citrus sinensis TaxID=2711 RepID=A0A067GAR9_CITSI|nr:hypothetical protein CISIN_1g032414mg [Citrus sinensis]